jgi:hypothetical protein
MDWSEPRKETLKKRSELTRRRFLIVILVVFIGIALVLAVLPVRFLNLNRRIANYKKLSLDKSYPTGMLSEKEMVTILALSKALVPKDETLETGDDFFRNHINYKTSNVRGYLKEYREGVRLLEETTKEIIGANNSFSELSMSEIEKVLESILWRYRSDEVIESFLEKFFVSKRKLAFREFVVRDILKAFYKSRAGWAVVGYSHFPGVPAKDPREYTRSIQNSIP